MPRRSLAQLALVVIGLIVWAYGQRANDPRLIWIGIGCFALATILRFFKKKDHPPS